MLCTSNPHPASIFFQNIEQSLLEGVKWCLSFGSPFLACLSSDFWLDWLLLRLFLVLLYRYFLSAPSGLVLFFFNSRLRSITDVAFPGLHWSVHCLLPLPRCSLVLASRHWPAIAPLDFFGSVALLRVFLVGVVRCWLVLPHPVTLHHLW